MKRKKLQIIMLVLGIMMLVIGCSKEDAVPERKELLRIANDAYKVTENYINRRLSEEEASEQLTSLHDEFEAISDSMEFDDSIGSMILENCISGIQTRIHIIQFEIYLIDVENTIGLTKNDHDIEGKLAMLAEEIDSLKNFDTKLLKN